MTSLSEKLHDEPGDPNKEMKERRKDVLYVYHSSTYQGKSIHNRTLGTPITTGST